MEQIGTLIYANGIGDHLVTLPAVRALSRLLRGRLRLVTFPGAAELYYRDVPFVDVIATPFRDLPSEGRSFDARAVAQRIARCPLLISLNPWHSRSMDDLLRLAKPHASIGFDDAFQAYLPPDFDRHSADMAFEVVRALDASLRIEDFAQPPQLDPEARRRGRHLRACLPRGARMLVVHADTRPWKEWRPEYYRAALHGFLDRHPNFIAFVLGTGDHGLDRGPNASQVLPSLGLHLHTCMALVEAADLFLGIDSCLLHAADLFRTPGVGLFGATRVREWGFRFGPHVHIDCGPRMDRDRVRHVVSALTRLHRCSIGDRVTRPAPASGSR